MSTKSTAIGPNSIAINYSVDSNATEVLQAIEDFITTKGWVLADSETGHALKRMYRAINADNTSYKYMMLDLSNAAYIMTTVYESWNAATHTGTNIAATSDSTANSQRLSLAYSGYIYIFATARWCVMQTRMNDGFIGSVTGNSWSGCIEISKDNPDEVPGEYPIYAFCHGYSMQGYASATTRPNCYSLPRTIFGATGTAANTDMSVSTLAGLTWDNTARLYDMLPVGANPLSEDSDIFLFTPFAVQTRREGTTYFNVRGRFYGLKMLSHNLGSLLDKITIKCDTENFYSPSGADREHHILTAGSMRFAIPS